MTRNLMLLLLLALLLPAIAQARQSQSQLNYGVLLYGQQNYSQAEAVLREIGTPDAQVWLARTFLQQERYRLAVETATRAREQALVPKQDEIARRIQIAAIRLGGLQQEYAGLAGALGIRTEHPWQITVGADMAVVTGLLREFDVAGNAVRDDDLRLSISASGAYRLPFRPGGWLPVAGYRFTHRHFFENQGFIQQNHQPFVSISRRVNDDLSLAFRYDHTTSLSGTGLDLFVRQNGLGATAVYRLDERASLRGGYTVTYSNFNNSDDDDNLTNALSLAWTVRDEGAPLNSVTLGGRIALVSAESRVSAHTAVSLFAARQVTMFEHYQVRLQGVVGRAQFNQDDPTDNERRKDTTISASASVEREVGHDITLSGALSISRVISTIDRVDRTSAVVGVGLRRKF